MQKEKGIEDKVLGLFFKTVNLLEEVKDIKKVINFVFIGMKEKVKRGKTVPILGKNFLLLNFLGTVLLILVLMSNFEVQVLDTDFQPQLNNLSA